VPVPHPASTCHRSDTLTETRSRTPVRPPDRSSARPTLYTAPVVVTMAGPPLTDGAVLVGAEGRIEGVGPVADFAALEGVIREAVPGLLMPGLVNLHTHLELTGLASDAPADDFPRWIRTLRGAKAERSPEWFAEAARRGVRDAFAAGITTVADTGDSGAVLPALVEAGGSGIVYQEVFGPHPSQRQESLMALRKRVDQLLPLETPRVRLGLSPHAPYTVSGPLYRVVRELSDLIDRPLAVHLAESPAERDFVTRNAGPFAAAWAERGIPPLAEQRGPGVGPNALRSPVAWLDAHGILGPRTLCIHTVELDETDIRVLADRRVAVAHCPVSNRRHGHRQAPLRQLLDAGVRLGVGTDSVLSVGSLDLFAELRAARELAGLDARGTLALATNEAAAALDLRGEVGRLASGFYADLIGLDVPLGGGDPEEAALGASPDRVLLTVGSGRVVYRQGPPA
jgi:cytosine/adenosine deaminase-related metal-dependent hydrolase